MQAGGECRLSCARAVYESAHVFVSIKGSAYARFRRALETDSASLATAAAYELPQLNLADALRLCLIYTRADRPRFERARVRWHARLCLDAKGLGLPPRTRAGSGDRPRRAPPTPIRPPARRNRR